MIRIADIANRRDVSRAVEAALGLAVFILAADRQFYERTAADAFFSITLASFLTVYLSISERPGFDLLRVAVVGAVLSGFQLLVLRVGFRWLPALAMLGAGGFTLEIMNRVRRRGDRPRVPYAVLPPLLLVLLGYFGSPVLALTGALHAHTLDADLYIFDQSLGLQISCWVGRFILPHRSLVRAAVWLYYGLPLPLMWVYARQLVREKQFALTAFLAFFMTAPLGWLFYNLVPACGPIYLLGSRFPWQPPEVQQLGELSLSMASVTAARNAFPSLHMGWALLIWWYSKGLSWRIRAPLLLFLLGTAVAILGLGEHYFVDLAAAFPFALLIEAACALQLPMRNRRRFGPLLTSLVLLLGWVGVLRSGVQVGNAGISWLLILATIGASFILHARLQAGLVLNSAVNRD